MFFTGPFAALLTLPPIPKPSENQELRSNWASGRYVEETELIDMPNSPRDTFLEYLTSRNFSMTHERSVILDEVFASHETFDQEQLLSRLEKRSDGKRVSLSTVHKTVIQLEECGLIRRVGVSVPAVYQRNFM